MTYASYEIKNCLAFFDMLLAQFEEFKNDPTSSRKAILTTILAYHLREWLWKKHKKRISRLLSIQDESKYNKHVNKACANFNVIR
jgi:ATP-dependent DNA ligase